jgi:hypothetical protein
MYFSIALVKRLMRYLFCRYVAPVLKKGGISLKIGEVMFSGLLNDISAIIYFYRGEEITYHYLGDKPARISEDWAGSDTGTLDEFIELYNFHDEKIITFLKENLLVERKI